ncbi:MAG: Zn-dependent hydrolase [Sphingobacteriia bacterium]|nr:Zn-dependent hydrolase [Sphingobacteriia bacterium]
MKKITLFSILTASAMIFFSCAGPQSNTDPESQRAGIIPQGVEFEALPDIDMKAKLAGFAEFELTSDLSHLTADELEILPLLFKAANIMDDLYWKQAIGNRDDFLSRIKDEDTRTFARIHYGPWDRLSNNESFLTNISTKPAGANFYPEDMTKEEFEALDNPYKTSQYTLLRRDDSGNLKVIWYHEAYDKQIKEAADLIRKAADISKNEGLKNYLHLRAQALLNDDYQPSDMAWMDMKDSNVDFVVGPIENYEDQLFGYKAAYESFILIKDPEWSNRLQRFAGLLPNLQTLIPTNEKYLKDVPGSDSDLNVYDAIYYAGDCNAGSKTIAINLPNDPEVHVAKGTRKLQLKNSMKAKFDKIVVPIAEKLIDPEQQKHITFDAFFANTMFHEVAHGMGVKNTVSGKGSVREALKETYTSIEEGKADIMGLWLVTKLREMGEITDGELMDNFVTFFAGVFRSSRFGTASAHGKANMMRFNFFEDYGAFTRNGDGYYSIDLEKMAEAMNALVDKIMTIQGEGDYEAAKAWIEADGNLRETLRTDLARLNEGGIPVDILFKQGPELVGLK